jgi:hypothetical protein
MDCTRRSNERGVLAYLDASGMSMSLLCAVHCALMPLVVTILPWIGLGILAEDGAESILLGLSASLGIASSYLGYRVHRSGWSVILLAAGLGLLASGRIVEGWEYETIGLPLLVGGGLVVASSHLLNRRLCQTSSGNLGSPATPDDVSLALLPLGQASGRRADCLNPEPNR